MLSSNITVCIFAKNEEKRIKRTIKNFKGLFRVAVIDNFSDDNTEDVAKGEGCEVIKIKNPGYIENNDVMQELQSKCKTDYILLASCSEFIPTNLLRFYAKVANENSHDVIISYRESITAGVSIPISGTRESKHAGELRFFKKHYISYKNNIVHGRGEIKAMPERVLSIVKNKDLVFYQYRDYDSSHTELKHREYNDVLASQYFSQGKRFRYWKLLYHPIKHFVFSYFRSGSWKNGFLGFIHSYYRFQMEFGIWLRVWEHENNLLRGRVIELNNMHRETMEEDAIIFKE